MNQRTRFVTTHANPFRLVALATLIAASACSSAPPDAPASLEGTRIGTTRVAGLGAEITSHDTDAERSTLAADGRQGLGGPRRDL